MGPAAARSRSLLAAAALVVAGACTEPSDALDTGATEAAVARTLGPRLPVRVDEVRCPSPIERAAATTITCQVVLVDDAGTAKVQVTQRPDDELLVDLVDAVLDPAAVGRQLHDALVAEYARSFTVDCGTDVAVVVAVDDSISCSADDGTSRRKVTATVVDARGTLRFDLGGGT